MTVILRLECNPHVLISSEIIVTHEESRGFEVGRMNVLNRI